MAIWLALSPCAHANAIGPCDFNDMLCLNYLLIMWDVTINCGVTTMYPYSKQLCMDVCICVCMCMCVVYDCFVF